MIQPGSPPQDGVTPTLVLWEAHRELDAARQWRDELSTLEAVRLLNEVRCFGRIAFQLVGRPLRRADAVLLVEHGARIGLSMRLAPGPDPLHEEKVAELRDAGLTRIVLDADARPAAALVEEIGWSRSYGLGVHVESTVTEAVLSGFAARAAELAEAGVHVWTLYFPPELPPQLRGAALDSALAGMAGMVAGLRLQVEVAGAPQLVRVLHERGAVRAVASAPAEGRGVLYVSVDGTLQVSAELSMALGNVRHDDVVDTFRDAPLLRSLRDPLQLRGKCRACEYAASCGGSRARAQALVGDCFAPDPACAYRPAGYRAEEERHAVGASH